MKRKKYLWILAPVLAFGVLAAGCSEVSVTSIEKTASYATEDTYTVTYSDGTSSTFTVQHGKDVTVQQLFDRYKEEYGEDLTYEEFLQKYLTLTDESLLAVNKGLLSSMWVKATNNKTTQQGSAVLYSVSEEKDEAYILTNYHVTYLSSSNQIASNITCYLYGNNQTAFSCTYVGGSAGSSSTGTDIAILKTKLSELKKYNESVQPVTLGTSCCVGETVYAIGNAEGEGISATKGIVSVDSEEVTMSVDGTNRRHRVMRIDAAIYHGNSGGGLFNKNGELIGITNGGNETDQNINYAIPLSTVKGTADNILHYYNDGDATTSGAYKILLGFTSSSQNPRYVYDELTGKGYIQEDITVASVEGGLFSSNSIAYTMGIRTNDIITGLEINGTPHTLKCSYEIFDLLLTVRAGDVIKLNYKRGGATESKASNAYTVKTSDLTKI